MVQNGTLTENVASGIEMGSYIDIEISIDFPLICDIDIIRGHIDIELSFLDTYLFISSVFLACNLTIKPYFVYILIFLSNLVTRKSFHVVKSSR